MTSPHELLNDEARAWRDLMTRFNRIEGAGWNRSGAAGDWSPKDVLAHIACWHAEAEMFFEQLRSADTPPRWPDVETFNAESREKCRDMTAREVQAMSGAARHRFREEISLVAEPLAEKHVRAIRNCGALHYAGHIEMLDAFLEKSE